MDWNLALLDDPKMEIRGWKWHHENGFDHVDFSSVHWYQLVTWCGFLDPENERKKIKFYFQYLYRVSQQVWDKLRNVCERSALRLQKKIVFCSKKLLFQPFLGTARNDNGFLSHFSPISDNLLNKLLHKIIEEKLPKNSIFIFAVQKKGWKSNFMEQNTFFRKIRNLRLQTSELQNITFSLSQTCWDTLYLRISICFKLFFTDNVAWSRILFFNSNSFSDPTKQDVFAVIKVLKSKLTFFLLSPVLNYNLLGLKKSEKCFLPSSSTSAMMASKASFWTLKPIISRMLSTVEDWTTPSLQNPLKHFISTANKNI